MAHAAAPDYVFFGGSAGGGIECLREADWTSIAVIRDPTERILSAFLDKRRSPANDKIRRRLPRRAWSNFGNFVDVLSTGDFLYADPHWAPQSWQLGDTAEAVDHLIPLPNLDRCLSAIAQELGINPIFVSKDPPWKVTNARLQKHEYLAWRTRGLLSELYSHDANLFRAASAST